MVENLENDHALILTGRSPERLASFSRHRTHLIDYSFPETIERFRQGEKTPLNGIVLMTPRLLDHTHLMQDEKEWLALFQLGFTRPFELLKAALEKLKPGGKIVIIGGTTTKMVIEGWGPNAVIRRMWTTLLKHLPFELKDRKIYVNMISPGVVRTHHHIDRIATEAEKRGRTAHEQERLETAHIPLQRFATAEEVAKHTRFLLSTESDYLNGVNMILDGGAIRQF